MNNTSKSDQNIVLELWKNGNGITIGWQSVSGNGIHIFEECKYFPQNRSVTVLHSSTKTESTYEQIFTPEKITTANDLIDYVKHRAFGFFPSNYKPPKELIYKLNGIL